MAERPHLCLNDRESPEPSWWEKDAQGIPLDRVCSKCRSVKLAKYTTATLAGYNQGDIDEPIDDSL